MKKRITGIVLSTILAAGMLMGCSSTQASTASSAAPAVPETQTEMPASSATASDTAASTAAGTSAAGSSDLGDISVVSREDGSGTRGAFIELFGVQDKDANGNKVDNTTVEATIANSTEVMMTTVAGDVNAIGYTSLGAMNDTVKAVKIDGAEATVDNVKSGTYKISRPFNIVTKDKVSDAATDFINYIMSADGQKIVEDNGYITVNDKAEAFKSTNPSGKIVIAGSSSVTPVMEKLKEAYNVINSGLDIEIQESDSTTGITSAIEGTCDIGMASRDLHDDETGVTATAIATDGIAVIVNNGNPVTDLTSAQVNDIFRGNITAWSDIK